MAVSHLDVVDRYLPLEQQHRPWLVFHFREKNYPKKKSRIRLSSLHVSLVIRKSCGLLFLSVRESEEYPKLDAFHLEC